MIISRIIRTINLIKVACNTILFVVDYSLNRGRISVKVEITFAYSVVKRKISLIVFKCSFACRYIDSKMFIPYSSSGPYLTSCGSTQNVLFFHSCTHPLLSYIISYFGKILTYCLKKLCS